MTGKHPVARKTVVFAVHKTESDNFLRYDESEQPKKQKKTINSSFKAKKITAIASTSQRLQ